MSTTTGAESGDRLEHEQPFMRGGAEPHGGGCQRHLEREVQRSPSRGGAARASPTSRDIAIARRTVDGKGAANQPANRCGIVEGFSVKPRICRWHHVHDDGRERIRVRTAARAAQRVAGRGVHYARNGARRQQQENERQRGNRD